MFCVVDFVDEENTCGIVQESWTVDKASTHCPPSTSYGSFIKKVKVPPTTIAKWPIHKVKILKRGIVSYEEAKKETKNLSDFGDTENEEIIKAQRALKRKHPVATLDTEQFDLRAEMKKAKCKEIEVLSQPINEEVDEKRFNNEVGNEITGSSSFVYVNSNEWTDVEDEIDSESSKVENIPCDSNSLIIIEMKKCMEMVKREILDEIQKNVRGASNQKFKKICSRDEFFKLIEDCNDPKFKQNLLHTLKMLPDTSGCYNKNHGRVATIMYFLFEKSFIMESLTWGEMKGNSCGKICLVNYQPFYELVAQAMIYTVEDNDVIPSAKEVRSSFQIFFKHKAKKI